MTVEKVIFFLVLTALKYEATQAELTDAEMMDILEEHNDLRAAVTPAAANMQKMVWDDKLAKIASDFSKKCKFTHNTQRSKLYPGYVGENLAATSSGTPSYTGLVNNWFNEKSNYNYDTNTCAKGKTCGHYTQVVWAKSRRLGCGATKCEKFILSNGKVLENWTFLVCDYAPGGNYYGQKPYAKGSYCSQCASNEQCDGNLCKI